MSNRHSLFVVRKIALVGLLCGALSACGDKQADAIKAAADEATASTAQAAAAAAEQVKAAAEAAQAKVQEETNKALGGKKDELKLQLQNGLDAADRKVAYLRDKAEKLKGAAKQKADSAFAAYESAKTSAKELVSGIDSVNDVPGVTTVSNKVSEALKSVGLSVDSAEDAALPKKK